MTAASALLSSPDFLRIFCELQVVDEGTVFEIMPDFAQNIICCFARMNGRAVGVCMYVSGNYAIDRYRYRVVM